MKRVQLPQGEIAYVDVGEGPVLMFVHGLLVDHRLWADVIERLRGRFRCIAPCFPVGSHATPMREGADLSLRGQARLVTDLLDALALDDVTLVGNDTGGVICQLVVAEAPPRVGALVLLNCDAFEVMPPDGFGYLRWAPRIPGAMRALFTLLLRFPSLRRLPMAYGALTKRRLPDELLTTWLEPAARDPRVRRDLRGLLDGIGNHVTLDVAERLHRFEGPALLLWSKDDRFFPISLGERLVTKLRHGRLEVLEGAGTFVALDVPDAVADGIARFLQTRRAAA